MDFSCVLSQFFKILHCLVDSCPIGYYNKIRRYSIINYRASEILKIILRHRTMHDFSSHTIYESKMSYNSAERSRPFPTNTIGNKHLKYRNLSTRPQHLRKQIFHSAQAEFHPSQTDFTSLQMTFHFTLTIPCLNNKNK